MLKRKPHPVLVGLIFPLLTSVIIVGLSCGRDPERASVAGKLPAPGGPPAPPAARAPSPLPARKPMPRSARWSEVDKLTADQKFEEARRVVAEIHKLAQKADNAADRANAAADKAASKADAAADTPNGAADSAPRPRTSAP